MTSHTRPVLTKPKLPYVTIAVGTLTATMSIVELARPDLLCALERHPTVGASWVSWRLLTSLVVHDGLLALTFNFVGFAIVGSAVERRAGAARWLLLYLAGGTIGQLVGLTWASSYTAVPARWSRSRCVLR